MQCKHECTTDSNGRTPKLKQTQMDAHQKSKRTHTDEYPNQNGRWHQVWFTKATNPKELLTVLTPRMVSCKGHVNDKEA